ncbi:MAG: GTPase-activating protein [Trichlorobacter sp.]|jgi:hypothetical protein
MLILPRSNPLYEHLPSHKIKLPEVLTKMASGGFTGYLSYLSPTAEAYALFAKGALISTLLLEGERRKSGFEAISGLFDCVVSQDGQFNVYRMTTDLVMCTHALLHGDAILQSQEVRTVDLKALLERMKLQAINGTVLFTSAERNAMIFYKEGTPLGFYHDAVREIETSPHESQKVAALPGACVEVRSSQPTSDLMLHNLLEMVNIERLWEGAQQRSAKRPVPSSTATPAIVQDTGDHSNQLLDIVADLQEIASAYLSRQGATLVDRQLQQNGGSSLLLDPARTASLLAAVAAEATAIDPEAKVTEMIDLMQAEIAGRLSV